MADLEALVLTLVDVLLKLGLAGGDEGGVLGPGGDGHPCVIQHLKTAMTQLTIWQI